MTYSIVSFSGHPLPAELDQDWDNPIEALTALQSRWSPDLQVVRDGIEISQDDLAQDALDYDIVEVREGNRSFQRASSDHGAESQTLELAVTVASA